MAVFNVNSSVRISSSEMKKLNNRVKGNLSDTRVKQLKEIGKEFKELREAVNVNATSKLFK